MSTDYHVPALAPPKGVISNFTDPYSLKPAFIATIVLCLPLATAAVVVRLATGLRGADRRLRVEDCMHLILRLEGIRKILTRSSHLRHIMGWSAKQF